MNVCFTFCTDEENGHFTNFYDSITTPRMIDRESEAVIMSLIGRPDETRNFKQVDYSCKQYCHFFFFK